MIWHWLEVLIGLTVFVVVLELIYEIIIALGIWSNGDK